MADKIKITLIKSTIGAVPKHRKTVESMGLRKLNKSIILPDNAATRGQITQIRHLIKIEEIDEVKEVKPKKAAKAALPAEEVKEATE